MGRCGGIPGLVLLVLWGDGSRPGRDEASAWLLRYGPATRPVRGAPVLG